MAHVASRVMVHEVVLNWHERHAELERKAQALAEDLDNDQAFSTYAHVDSD